MPTSIADVLSCCPALRGPILWGRDPKCLKPGVYLVCMPYTSIQPPFDSDLLQHWVANAVGMTIGSVRATAATAANALCMFWHADETILYVGSTGRTISERIHQYYGTPIGFGRPHRGGYWIKTLANIRDLTVYWSPSDDPEGLEKDLQELFIGKRAGTTADLPFGNLQREKDKSHKAHGIANPEF